jgi:hypothetical protein
MSQLRLDENAVAPGTPSAGKSIIYPKADGLWYSKDDAGVETPLGNVAVGTAGYVLRSDGTSWVAGPASRAVGTTSSATPTPNVDTTDLYFLTALAEAAAFGAPTGTPVNSQKLLIRIKDNGTGRALTWDAAYVAGGTALPSTTVASKILTIGFIYNTDNALNKWMCVGSQQET